MVDAILYACPAMNDVFGKVWGSAASIKVSMPKDAKYSRIVTDYLRKVESAHDVSKDSDLVFGT